MWLTRVLNFVRTQEPIIKKHTNEFTGFQRVKMDRSWGRRKTKMMTAHVYGRQRNCARLSMIKMNNILKIHTGSRKAARQDFAELCDLRIESSCKELHYNNFYMVETLATMNIGLNRKVLANMAIWEPRTFRSVVGLCAHQESLPEDEGGLGRDKTGPGTDVVSRGLF